MQALRSLVPVEDAETVLRDTERRLRGYRTLPRGIEKSPSGGRVRRRRFFSPPWARPRARRQFFPDTHLVSQRVARQFLDPTRLVFPNFSALAADFFHDTSA